MQMLTDGQTCLAARGIFAARDRQNARGKGDQRAESFEPHAEPTDRNEVRVEEGEAGVDPFVHALDEALLGTKGPYGFYAVQGFAKVREYWRFVD